jgi:hypothetical protein
LKAGYKYRLRVTAKGTLINYYENGRKKKQGTKTEKGKREKEKIKRDNDKSERDVNGGLKTTRVY